MSPLGRIWRVEDGAWGGGVPSAMSATAALDTAARPHHAEANGGEGLCAVDECRARSGGGCWSGRGGEEGREKGNPACRAAGTTAASATPPRPGPRPAPAGRSGSSPGTAPVRFAAGTAQAAGRSRWRRPPPAAHRAGQPAAAPPRTPPAAAHCGRSAHAGNRSRQTRPPSCPSARQTSPTAVNAAAMPNCPQHRPAAKPQRMRPRSCHGGADATPVHSRGGVEILTVAWRPMANVGSPVVTSACCPGPRRLIVFAVCGYRRDAGSM